MQLKCPSRDEESFTIVKEAELTDDDRFWIITLSYKSPVVAGGAGQAVFTGDRGYKVFKPLAEPGEI